MAKDKDGRNEFGRVVAVVAFYVFSCSCYYRKKRTNESKRSAAKFDSTDLWKEEIENGPSLLHSPSGRITHTSSSQKTSTSTTSTQISPPGTPSGEFELPCLPPPAFLGGAPKKIERITTVSIEELRRIHPPINELHPPVASAPPKDATESQWMMLPPPPAHAIRTLNRWINASRDRVMHGTPTSNFSLDTTTTLREGSYDSPVPQADPLQTINVAAPLGAPSQGSITIEMENMLRGDEARGGGAQKKRVRYVESVLNDMETQEETMAIHEAQRAANRKLFKGWGKEDIRVLDGEDPMMSMVMDMMPAPESSRRPIKEYAAKSVTSSKDPAPRVSLSVHRQPSNVSMR